MDSNAARTFLAITLSMVVIILWQIFISSKYTQRGADIFYTDAEIYSDEKDNQILAERENENVEQLDKEEGIDSKVKSEIVYEEKTARLSNNFFEAVFSNRGGSLKSFELKKYYLSHMPNKRVYLVPENDYSLLVDIKSKNYKLTGKEAYEIVEVSERKIVFELKNASGIIIRKEFELIGDYELFLNVSLINRTGKDFLFKPYLIIRDTALKGGLTKESMNSGFEEFYYPVCLANDALYDGKDLKKGSISKSQEGRINWLASSSRYFISAIIPINQKLSMCRFESDKDYNFTAELIYPEIKVESSKEVSFAYKVYMGPKGYSMLKKIGFELERAVDFGWLAVLCIPLLYLLNLFNSVVHNYGVSIILLTIIIKIISIPFTQKSMKSMQELQKLKPKIDELQKKYKDNRDKLNEEMMRLYREHGVSPFGGCLPMLLQMPIWFALYRMLSNSVELYQAVFIPGWINDLSAKDPYYILPILLGVGTFLQQKLTPSTMDSTQAKVMLYFMPAFLTFIMISLPSGLTLYIFVSSLLSIFHQIYMNKKNQFNKIQPKSTREEEK